MSFERKTNEDRIITNVERTLLNVSPDEVKMMRAVVYVTGIGRRDDAMVGAGGRGAHGFRILRPPVI